MRQRSDARRGIGDGAAGLGLRPGDEFGDGLERRLVGGGQKDRQVDEAHDRHEILVDVVGHGHAERGNGDHGGRRQQDGVAVGFRLGDDLGADDGAAARLVLDDYRLAKQSGELLGDDAGRGVGRSARRIGHDEADGPLGKRLRATGLRNGGHSRGSQKMPAFHVSSVLPNLPRRAKVGQDNWGQKWRGTVKGWR